MKKVIYSLLFVGLLFFGMTRVNACMISFDELKEKGQVTINNKEEIDNIYVAGDYIITNLIKASQISKAGVEAKDVVRYNTETGVWSRVDGSKLDTTKQIPVKFDVDGSKIVIDFIQDENELVEALKDPEGANVVSLTKNMEGVNTSLNIDRKVSFLGNGYEIIFSKQVSGDAIVVNNDEVTISDVILTLTNRRNIEDRRLIRLSYVDKAELKDLVFNTDYTAIVVDESSVNITGELNFNNVGSIAVVVEDHDSESKSTIVVADAGKIVNVNEQEAIPTINVEEEGASLTLGSDFTTEGEGHYLDKDNASYTEFGIYGNGRMLPTEKTATYSSNDIYISGWITTELTNGSEVTVKVTGITMPEGATFKVLDDNDTTRDILTTKEVFKGTYGDFVSNSFYGYVIADKIGNYSMTVSLYSGETLIKEDTLEIEVLESYSEMYEYTYNPFIDRDSQFSYVPVDPSITAIQEGVEYYVEDSEGGYVLVENPVAADLPTYYVIQTYEVTDGWITAETHNEVLEKGSFVVTVEEQPEGSEVKVMYEGKDITKEEVNVAKDDYQTGDFQIVADTEGYYEVNITLVDGEGNEIDTVEVDFEYKDSTLPEKDEESEEA